MARAAGPCRRIRRTVRLGVSCWMLELGVPCGSAFSLLEPGCRWIRYTVRLGVFSSILDLDFRCGSALSVGAPDLRRIPYTMRLGVRNLAFETFRIAYTMRLGVAWASSVNGFRCGSASPVCYLISLGHRLSLDLHAARRRLGVVCQWIQMRLGVAWALSVTEFRCGSAPLW